MGILYESRHYASTRKELSRRFPGSDIGPWKHYIGRNLGVKTTWVSRHYGTKRELEKLFPGVELFEVKLGDKVCQNLAAIVDTRTVKNGSIDATQCEYGDLYRQYFDALRWIAFSLKFQFPDRLAQRMTFLDLGCRFGMCPNHPTHTGARCGDIQPYTLGPNNYTQKGDPRQQIWRPDGSLDLTVFDVARNSMLILMMAKAFPSLSTKQPILLHEIIRNEILNYAKINYSHEDYLLIQRATRPEDGYNHGLHMHVEIYGPVNGGMEL